ncbi:DUF2796 domain-containing protein [Pseudoalteromonas carrageenovora]|uniref:ZrgA family zinc uptake protein n=1 Tax=Pseudoalteromonas carrageenovora TaxID=227 RepID=UPI0021173984|nr:DUF2796 domain-containing protein [Pseudoalteromonas carrageenovora]MCQ8890382.1 DUF2796 domain-containing protein [Pseudoalteromonas carrageenovora]
MKTFKKGLSVALLLGLGFSAHAQKHVHGEGELLIAQEGNVLQMQFIIPAADALGFEHQAANSSDKNAIEVLAQQLKNSSHAIDIKGQCILQSTENSLAHSHDEHDHHNVEATYNFNCKTPVMGFSVTLFNLMPSLNALNVQWISNTGQGSTEVTRSNPVISWQS